MIIDSHCHLDYPVIYDHLDDVIKRANDNKVKYLLTISTTENSFKKIKIILGTKEIFRVESKKKSIIFRRSIVAAKHLSKGKKVFFSDLNFKRPGDGLEPDEWKQIVGKTLKRNIKYDQQLFLKYFRK